MRTINPERVWFGLVNAWSHYGRAEAGPCGLQTDASSTRQSTG